MNYLKKPLIEGLIISVIPVLSGDGTRLFKDGRTEQIIEVIEAKIFDTQLIQLHYKCKR